MRKGFTLVEVIVVILISFMALFGIETLIASAFKDWKTCKQIVDLERDLDLANYKIKWVLEESDDDTPLNSAGTASQNPGPRIAASYGNNTWKKEFYLGSGNTLVYQNDLPTSATEIIIGPPVSSNTLQSITFTNGSDGHSVKVDLTVTNGTNPLSSSFLVYLRNAPGG